MLRKNSVTSQPKLLSIAVAFSFSAASLNTHAIGLGSAPSTGVLNRPLQMQMPIMGEEFDLHNFEVKLANRKQHESMGIDFPNWMPQLKFNVIPSAQGMMLQVSSRQPITEPVANFVLAVKHNNTQFFKEITLLLDPVEIYQQNTASKNAANTLVTKTATVPVFANSSSQVKTNKSSPVKITKTAPKKAIRPLTYLDGESVKVERGQSLWTIAKAWKVENTSLGERMDTIFNTNPHAFINGDRNRLKQGVSLSLVNTFNVSELNTSQPVTKPTQTTTQNTSVKSGNSAIANTAPATTLNKVATAVSQQTNTSVTNKQTALEQKVKLLNETIIMQKEANLKLKQDLARLESIVEQITAQQQSALATVSKPQTSAPKISLPTMTAKQTVAEQPVVKTQGNFEQQANTENDNQAFVPPVTTTENSFLANSWKAGIWVGLGVLFIAFVGFQFKGKRKTKKFAKKLDNQLKDIAYNERRENTETPSVKELTIPGSMSSKNQIEYLRTAAEFYTRCSRFDLAKELVNESLIQFSGNKKIVQALLDIRKDIYLQLDETLSSGIVEKLDTGNFPQPGMVLESLEDEEDIQAINDEFIRQWNKKVTSIR